MRTPLVGGSETKDQPPHDPPEHPLEAGLAKIRRKLGKPTISYRGIPRRTAPGVADNAIPGCAILHDGMAIRAFREHAQKRRRYAPGESAIPGAYRRGWAIFTILLEGPMGHSRLGWKRRPGGMRPDRAAPRYPEDLKVPGWGQRSIR